MKSLERLDNLLRHLSRSLDELQQVLAVEVPALESGGQLNPQLAAARDLLREICADEWKKICQAAAELQTEVGPSRFGRLAHTLMQHYVTTTSSAELLDAILGEVMAETKSERIALVLYASDAAESEIVAAHNFGSRDLQAEEHRLSRTLLATVRQSQKSLRLSDVSQEEQFSLESSLISRPVRSVLLAPMHVRSQVVGAVYLENHRLVGAYSEADEQFMERTAALIALFLEATHRLDIIAWEGKATTPPVTARGPLADIVGQSPKLRACLQVVSQVADSSATILIEGESGTGKELIAQAIHQLSRRAANPFVAVNCAAIPETLVESELFGHEKGSFTGAHERKIGRVEQARGGTLFLDEIGELSSAVQAKLLRFLQSWEFERLGSTQTLKADVRVITATSRDLKGMMEERTFLEGLYYRLNVIPVSLPPLRERREDIPLLATHFLQRFAEAVNRPNLRFDRQVLLALEEYDFPGNVRELENLVQRLVLLSETDYITILDLPEYVLPSARRRMSLEKNPLKKFLRNIPDDAEEFRQRRAAMLQVAQRHIEELEDAFVQKLLEQTGGNIREAARLAGLNRSAIYRSKQRQLQRAAPQTDEEDEFAPDANDSESRADCI